MRELILYQSAEEPTREIPWMTKAKELMPSFHPKRLQEWVNARVALEMAFEHFGVRITPHDQFLGYHEISGQDEFRFSLSHSKDIAGALVVKRPNLPGLDIERIDRAIEQKIFERFSHPDDFNLDKLLLWSIKEAAYKCLPHEVQEKIWLNSIVVSDGKFRCLEYSGTWERVENEALMVVIANRSE